jgi:molybdopterin converting factor small subunit
MQNTKVQIEITVTFYSFFKELTQCAVCSQSLEQGATLGELIGQLTARFPKLAPMTRSMLTAVGVEYQDRNYVLRDRDEVSLFPPVQGG